MNGLGVEKAIDEFFTDKPEGHPYSRQKRDCGNSQNQLSSDRSRLSGAPALWLDSERLTGRHQQGRGRGRAS